VFAGPNYDLLATSPRPTEDADEFGAISAILNPLETGLAQGEPAPPMLWEIETLADLPQLVTFWQAEQATLRAYIQSLDSAALQATVEFGAAEAPQQAKRWHILLHLLNHSTQHRTELARYLTDRGHSPGDFDLLDLLMGKVG